MFLTIYELDNGRFIIKNQLTGIIVSRDGIARTFKSRKKAQKYITKGMRGLSEAITRLNRTSEIPKI